MLRRKKANKPKRARIKAKTKANSMAKQMGEQARAVCMYADRERGTRETHYS